MRMRVKTHMIINNRYTHAKKYIYSSADYVLGYFYTV